MIAFTVAGNPIPKARARVVVNRGHAHAYTPGKTKAWEARVARAARQAMGDREPLAGDLAVELRFYRSTRQRADCDNLAKAVLDAIQGGVVFGDDDQIVEMHTFKGVDRQRPRVEVRAWEVGA